MFRKTDDDRSPAATKVQELNECQQDVELRQYIQISSDRLCTCLASLHYQLHRASSLHNIKQHEVSGRPKVVETSWRM